MILEHLQTLATGDEAVKDVLITSFTPMVFKLVHSYASRFPDKREDIEQSGMVGLLTALNEISSGTVEVKESTTAYIWKYIQGSIRDFLRKDHIIPLTQHAFKKAMKSGEDIGEYISIFTPSTLTHELDFFDNPGASGNFFEPTAPQEIQSYLVNDFIDNYCYDDTDKKIVTYRLAGLTMTGVARKLGISKQLVSRRLLRMEERYAQS